MADLRSDRALVSFYAPAGALRRFVDNSIMLSRSIALLILGSLAFVSSTRAQDDPNWTRSFPPFRMIGNIY